MKKIFLCATLLTVTTCTLTSFNKKSFSWELLELYENTTYSMAGLKQVEEYNPDNDIISLPSLNDKDLFECINDLSICRREEVRKQLYIYLTRGRNYIKNSIRRSNLYMDIIKEEFKKHPDIPDDIMLLPLLESGFNPHAVSRSNAVGLWQFIRSTSRILGLKNNWWIDERRNIEKSTRAAICHLKNLYGIFNSWELALAAYNCGSVNVKKAMRRTRTENFWELRKTGTLTTETNEYVSRFAALLLIYKNQKLFGIYDEIGSVDEIETQNIILLYPMNIYRISKVTGVPLRTIRKLNPELKRNITPPYYRRYNFRIPEIAIKQIKLKRNKLYVKRFTKNSITI